LNNQQIKNVDCRLVESESIEHEHPCNYQSSSSLYKGSCFESYVKSIDRFSDNYFDIVFVDGRARDACIFHAKDKVKQGGYLIIDNSDRDHYFKGNDYLFDSKQWKEYHFIGAVPYSFDFSKTSFFQKL
jgi:hypothetical protein